MVRYAQEIIFKILEVEYCPLFTETEAELCVMEFRQLLDTCTLSHDTKSCVLDSRCKENETASVTIHGIEPPNVVVTEPTTMRYQCSEAGTKYQLSLTISSTYLRDIQPTQTPVSTNLSNKQNMSSSQKMSSLQELSQTFMAVSTLIDEGIPSSATRSTVVTQHSETSAIIKNSLQGHSVEVNPLRSCEVRRMQTIPVSLYVSLSLHLVLIVVATLLCVLCYMMGKRRANFKSKERNNRVDLIGFKVLNSH